MKALALPALAVAGFAVATVVVLIDCSAEPKPRSMSAPQTPWPSHIAASGIVEPLSGNVAVASPVAGILAALYVTPGDRVAAGDPLFKVDDREPIAAVPAAEARAKEASVGAARAKYLLKMGEALRAEGIVSDGELEKRRFDVASADAAAGARQAEVAQWKQEIDRRAVRSPISGRVLQVRSRVGEATGGAPVLVVGDDSAWLVRVNIDENDAARFQPGAKALALLRGDAQRTAPLTFVRVEPMMTPKGALTGEALERTDSRVLEALYRLEPHALPVYVGEQVDVFIDVDAQAQAPVDGHGAP